MENCPCGSNKDYALCCRPLIKGEQAAATAEQLMRSRYSAYVRMEMDYLLSSLHPDYRKDYDAQSSRAWAERAEWHGITIHKTTAGGAGDSTGTVEFTVFYTEKGIRQEHHEVSTFEKKDGSWYFTTGKLMPKPAVRAAPKVGRNDLCSCGSGKKFKKCCGK